MLNKLIAKQKKHTTISVIFTVLYGLLYQGFYKFAYSVFLITYSPSMPKPLGVLILVLVYIIPLSIPISIFLIWYSYFRKKFSRIPFLCFLPLLCAVGVYGLLTAFNFLDLFP